MVLGSVWLLLVKSLADDAAGLPVHGFQCDQALIAQCEDQLFGEKGIAFGTFLDQCGDRFWQAPVGSPSRDVTSATVSSGESVSRLSVSAVSRCACVSVFAPIDRSRARWRAPMLCTSIGRVTTMHRKGAADAASDRVICSVNCHERLSSQWASSRHQNQWPSCAQACNNPVSSSTSVCWRICGFQCLARSVSCRSRWQHDR